MGAPGFRECGVLSAASSRARTRPTCQRPDLHAGGRATGNIAGHAFLKQKLGRLDDRVPGVEAFAHSLPKPSIGDGDDAHGMVMRI